MGFIWAYVLKCLDIYNFLQCSLASKNKSVIVISFKDDCALSQ